MPELTVREFGRKPYIDPGKGIDGGYVNAMRRTTQKSEFDNPRVAMFRNNPTRGSIDQNDTIKEVTTPAGLITEYVSAAVIWGMTFDNDGGLYIGLTSGDIYYRPAGSTTFGALSQTSRDWEEMACSPINGDIWAIAFSAGIYLRASGTGDFVQFDATGFTCVDAAANGDIYALYNNTLYVRSGGAGVFGVVSGITSRGYTGLACAPNGDLYATVYGLDKVYVRTGGAGDFEEVFDLYAARAICAAPNGDIYLTAYTGFDYDLYRRAGGSGDFVFHYAIERPTQDMSVSPGGYLYLSSSLNTEHLIYQLNTDVGFSDPVNTIVQRHPRPLTKHQPARKNLKPYANKSYEEMQQYARPIEYTGTERQPETAEAKPILVDHIPEVSWYVRNGSPIVVDIPTTKEDPISKIEVLGGDGFASVAPNGTSAIYNPGASTAALLIIHTRSGQQCTVNLLAK